MHWSCDVARWYTLLKQDKYGVIFASIGKDFEVIGTIKSLKLQYLGHINVIRYQLLLRILQQKYEEEEDLSEEEYPSSCFMVG